MDSNGICQINKKTMVDKKNSDPLFFNIFKKTIAVNFNQNDLPKTFKMLNKLNQIIMNFFHRFAFHTKSFFAVLVDF